jgi:hypothetical protein
MKIGEETTIYAPLKTTIDETRPWLIDIGNNVKITKGVTILTHGFDWSVLKGVYGVNVKPLALGERNAADLHQRRGL